MAADQTEQADATSSTLRDMIHTMSSAQLLLRRWQGTAGDTGEPPHSSSSSASSSKEDAAAAAELQRTLQPELYATKAKLSRALSALTKMQAAYQQQQASIKQLELELQQYKEQQQQQAGAGADATAAGSNSKQAGMLSGLAAALAMAAGAGAASSQMSGQQQELRSQLAAAEDIERQLNNELQAKQEQMQKLKLQVRCCRACCLILGHSPNTTARKPAAMRLSCTTRR
jgi:molecular chaperone GrpE (heat shock protein)